MSTSITEPHGGDGMAPGGAGSGAAAPALVSPWNLCFLSGPMYGRTMSLARGANWIGTSADCEVILPDREIGAKQVCLQVGALAVTVQDHGGDAGAPVLFNDAPLGAGRRSLTPQDVVTVGSIRLGIARHAQASVAVPDERDAPEAAREAAWLGWLTGGLRRLGSRRLVLAVVALWVGVLLGALGYGLVAWSGRLPWQHESVLARTHRLQQLLHAYPELAVTPRDDGVIVSGYVSDAAARERVAQIVAGVDNAALGNLYVVSDLVATAQTYFSDTALTVSYLGRGRIELTGTAARAQIEPRIRNYMKDARPALEVVDHVGDAQAAAPRTTATLGGTAGIPEITTVFAGDGDQRYIETVDGNRYFEGAKLKDGPSVVSIGADEVVFERDGQRITMPLGGVPAAAPERAPAPPVPPVAPLASGAAAGVAQPVPGPVLPGAHASASGAAQ
ncbi:type III secretion system inner membrane ring subunit SctD [Burkholderia stagnalis]|uniref:type III secretion system inner membrane ring subunit SctD n=1 Tax=Burkholderia stagnalis TaxID=1503054 RepID=UPI0007529B28|nr:type III secretion system inner membrane ring subunit SctD [Burkholderia stagnalis]KVC61277.1 peptide-binding protein [Burkholderia stagnalis]KVN20200.1 peptide-binding protein [Burkholderia stagnalis]KWI71516.1 peptide-binding protein [Burkholderia stagnalis]KWK72555.1 peptide-binding protein [Burkholderia stagnalis]KWN10412.1 peptide-binding protein [Burkholderia stagnalis]